MQSIEHIHKERYAQAREALWGKPRQVNVLVEEKRAIEAMRRAERLKWERQQQEAKRRAEEANRAVNDAKRFELSFQVVAKLGPQEEQLVAYSVDTLFPRPTMERIARNVLIGFPGITLDHVRSKSREKPIYEARKAVAEDIRRLRPDKCFTEIGRFLNRDHTTILSMLGRLKGKGQTK